MQDIIGMLLDLLVMIRTCGSMTVSQKYKILWAYSIASLAKLFMTIGRSEHSSLMLLA
jgi:hypothetical protein